jgi:LPS O-antigen subunit length determinant protein (WzzB/FepE family)
MSDMQSLHDDEIDLFELVETLWNGKWLLAIFTTIPVLLSLVFVVF